jgi:Holliday junction resolvase RusA-like endonuclease
MMIPARGNRKAFIYSGNYRQAKKKVQDYLEKHYSHLKGYLADHPQYYYTTVKYIAWDNWLTKSSKYLQLRKKDVANYTKNAEDVIFSFLGADDSSIIESNIQKGMMKPDQAVALCCEIQMYAMDADALKRKVEEYPEGFQ